MELAVPQLSPVTTKLFIFMDLRVEMTLRALGFNGSEMARIPVSWPSMETRIPVWAKHRHHWADASSGGSSDSDLTVPNSDNEEHCYAYNDSPKLQFRKDISKALWKQGLGMAEIISNKGRMWTTTGIVHGGKLYGFLEYALFLAEIGSLHLLDDEDKCISLEDIYKKVAEVRIEAAFALATTASEFFPMNDDVEKRQPETKAIMRWLKQIRFTASATLHGGALVL
ncbi:hypothetical protein L2E82_08759 [Cichorium intybus]|uniref:Uncharacterized protein n=1 Tax=Cichorium intybus TaxID=13427 RepID=A0ACB9G800_CICIN|nr:hypothetical protein L2E82_08759 [Cichorium intybus]